MNKHLREALLDMHNEHERLKAIEAYYLYKGWRALAVGIVAIFSGLVTCDVSRVRQTQRTKAVVESSCNEYILEIERLKSERPD